MTIFPYFSGSNSSNHTASDLFPGVSSGLGVKIIRAIVDDHRPADHILRPEAACFYRQKALSPVFQQRWKISHMLGMRPSLGIQMASRFSVVLSAAAAALMDVKAEKTGFGFRQAMKLRRHQSTAGHRIEGHASPKSVFSPYPGNRLGSSR